MKTADLLHDTVELTQTMKLDSVAYTLQFALRALWDARQDMQNGNDWGSRFELARAEKWVIRAIRECRGESAIVSDDENGGIQAKWGV